MSYFNNPSQSSRQWDIASQNQYQFSKQAQEGYQQYKSMGTSSSVYQNQINNNYQENRFDREKPGVTVSFAHSSVKPDETYHQKTGFKNQSQINFGTDSSTFSKSNGSSFNQIWKQPGQQDDDYEDPRYPRKKQNQKQESDQFEQRKGGRGRTDEMTVNQFHSSNQIFSPNLNDQFQPRVAPSNNRFDNYQEIKSARPQTGVNYQNRTNSQQQQFGGSIRDRYLQERKQTQEEQIPWTNKKKGVKFEDEQQDKNNKEEDNSWQKTKPSKKGRFEDKNHFVGDAPFGIEGKQPQINKDQRPYAGPGAFTSIKYSGNPPGGKSSISFY